MHEYVPSGQSEIMVAAPEYEVRIIFLVGFMGAGKSSVGLALSRRLSWPFEDLDQRIETREHKSIKQIFEQSGEAAFRQMEHAALASIVGELDGSPKVVALGGGAFAQADNAALLERAGLPVVFLDAPVEELFRRCQDQPELARPMRRGLDEFRGLYEARQPSYLKATVRIETSGMDVEQVAEEAITRLRLRPRKLENGREEG